MARADRINLTTGRVNSFACSPDKAQAFLWDIDAPGLAVRATPKGTRAFIFQGYLGGASLRVTIGDCRSWTIDKARAEARRLQTLLDQGIDPREQKRELAEAKATAKRAKEAAEAEAENRKKFTLKALCLAYVDHLQTKGKRKTATDTKSAFKVHVFEAWPEYANTPAGEITSENIAAIVRKVREAGKERTAGILRNYLTAAYNAARRAPFDSGIASALILFRITNNPVEAIPTIPVNRGNRTLSVSEIRAYLAELGEDDTGQVLRVALMAGGQRMAQLLRAKVSDYDETTKTLRLWDAKGKRTHAREHLLPLAEKAASIVGSLVKHRESDDNQIFRTSERLTGNRVAEVAAKMAGEPFNLRDIRRTCETMLAGMGISRDIRAQLLSHGISGVQAAHYDRWEYIDEKRNALEAWERRLDDITTGRKTENVVQMKRKGTTA